MTKRHMEKGMLNRRALTLLELLIVIAVIAVLITLALLAIGGVRDKATSIQCLSNLRQLQQGLTLYSGKDGLLPYATFVPFAPDGPARPYQDMVNGWCDAMNVARPQRTAQKTSKGWWVNDVAPVFCCPVDKPFTVSQKDIGEMAYDPAFSFASQVLSSVDYRPGTAMTRFAVAGIDPEVTRRTVTRVWEQAPWTPVLEELWQWHQYKSPSRYGQATYLDGSARRADQGTQNQQDQFTKLMEAALPPAP